MAERVTTLSSRVVAALIVVLAAFGTTIANPTRVDAGTRNHLDGQVFNPVAVLDTTQVEQAYVPPELP